MTLHVVEREDGFYLLDDQVATYHAGPYRNAHVVKAAVYLVSGVVPSGEIEAELKLGGFTSDYLIVAMPGGGYATFDNRR